MDATLYCDGASRGNPGPAAFGFVLMSSGSIIAKEGGRLGIVTNNVAEYEGLIRGLEKSLDLGIRILTVKSDSELLIRQLNGAYSIKASHLKPLGQKAKKLLARFTHVELIHIPRGQNAVADKLANQALDFDLA